ncbi:hypothetical protein A1O1_01234 [Capronia coronata CBS 617.96]|uniref:NB-ARC domain-containing protein n=1 Tax=Capronia coronata CBS 617.96 TaxID=1182541 RepID=W9YUB0_9EURO|nr:uncharacterized protein A1O1_01234 [Capronia coronata CBS 617.96]EXJ96108.1 hypothetical protein A1O1_01234 [Capronia coronata CBS 617.96]
MSILELTESSSHDSEPSHAQATVDIVAVHGLHEQARETWTDPASGTLWLRDLFPHRAQNARILAYDYPVQSLISSGEGSASQLLPLATSLVAELAAYRWHDNGMERPLIFIGHGFGGLLIKKALVHASAHRSKEMESSIYTSTFAILFMGTPHRGMEKSFLFAPNNLISTVNRRFLNSLLRDSPFLTEVTDQFAPVMKRFTIFNFWEEIMTTVGNIRTFVVHEDSAAPAWDIDERCGIQATHSGMVKFKSKHDSGYRVVHAALIRYQRDALSLIQSRWRDELSQRSAEREQQATELRMQNQRQSSPAQKLAMGCGATERREYVVPHASTNFFIGRHVHAKEAREALGPVEEGPAWRKPKVLVVCGLGGAGKTQFVLRYAEEARSVYWGVFWIDASSIEALDSGLASLAMMYGKGSTPPSAVHWLSTCLKPWLLVFDNADELDMDISRYFPPGGNGHIMVTTRNPGANVYATVGCMRLSGMDPEEAITLLLRAAYPEPEPQTLDPTRRGLAQAIAQRLGYLAIALAQAGATIRNKIYTLEVYLHHYLGHRKLITSRHNTSGTVHADTITTWEIPFQKIAARQSTEYQDAVELVHIFAFLHFESIPEKIFRRSWHDLPSVSSTKMSYPRLLQMDGPWDEEAQARFRRAIRILYDHSIIDHDPDSETCSLHPVVHQWAQERMAETDQMKWLTCTSAILSHCVSPHLEASGQQFRRSLLPHIDACLRELRFHCQTLPDTLSRAAEVERFASVYAENGRWKHARALQQSVLDLRRKRLGRWHEETLRIQQSLAHTDWNLFEVESAISIQRAVLITRWWLRPSLKHWLLWPPWKPTHIEYCLALDDLTLTLWLAGLRELSKRTGERAVRGLIKILGPDDPRTLNAMFNLARTYLHMGQHQISHKLLVRVLVKRKKLFGMNHPDTLMTRNELGMNICAQKMRLAVAERLVANVVESRKQILGEEHAYTLWSINDLAKVLCERQKATQAVDNLEAIIPVVVRTLGEKHVGMTMTKSNLARAYVLCERWAEAETLLTGLVDVIPPRHPDSIHNRSGLVHVKIRMGKLAEAERDCLALVDDVECKKIIDPDSPRAGIIYEQLLEIYQLQDRGAELEAVRKKVPSIQPPAAKKRFDMLPVHRLLRRESELELFE